MRSKDWKVAEMLDLQGGGRSLVVCCSYSTFMLWSIPHYKKIRKDAIWYVTDIYSNLLLDYVVLIKRI